MLFFIFEKENADIVYEKLKNLPGVVPRKPSGAMYMMVGLELQCFPAMKTDLDFVQMLIKENSVFCLPASVSRKNRKFEILIYGIILEFNFSLKKIFECPNYIRIVITMQKEKIIEACDRIEDFVLRHYSKF